MVICARVRTGLSLQYGPVKHVVIGCRKVPARAKLDLRAEERDV